MYLEHYRNDIAISYAAADNVVFHGATTGWVARLLDDLQVFLNLKLGCGRYALWSPAAIAGHQEAAAERLAQLQDAATLVVLLSPNYLQDSVYQAELTALLAQYDPTAHRLFVVELTQLERPEPLRGLTGYRLWTLDNRQQPRTLGLPDFYTETDKTHYFHQLEDLARDLSGELKTLRTGSAVPAMPESTSAPAAVASSQPQVFLAEVTDDLYMQREEVKRYLEYQAIKVLPEKLYSFGEDAAQWEAALAADLAESVLFVQLLNGTLMVRPAGMSTPQRQLAYVQRQCPQLPVMQWRPPDLDLHSVQDAGLREVLEAEVQANPLERFKADILRQVASLTTPVAAPPNRYALGERETDCQMVFINACWDDVALAERLGAYGSDCYEWLCVLPLTLETEPPDPEAAWADLETHLRSCDALLLLYGDSPKTWVRQQLQQMVKIIARREPRPFVAICEVDPLPKPDLRMNLPRFIHVLECGALSEAGILQRFVQAMGGGS